MKECLQKKKHLSKGFTLVEIIVSIGIFSMVVTVAVSALIVLNNASREARAIRATMDNANSAVESVTRLARMGFQFDAGCTKGVLTSQTTNAMLDVGNSSSGADCLAFYAPDKAGTGISRYMFRMNGARMERSLDRGGSWLPMTAPEVEITRLKFYVNGSDGNNNQPFITLVMKGMITSTKVPLPFSVQASVTPRTPNSSLIYKDSL